jgi:hypothetical protein
MTLRRHHAVRIALLGGLALFAGCVRGIDAPVQEVQVAKAATFAKKPHGLIATRVLIDKTGTATIEFRTGLVDDATNSQIPGMPRPFRRRMAKRRSTTRLRSRTRRMQSPSEPSLSTQRIASW